MKEKDAIRKMVREEYAKAARKTGCCSEPESRTREVSCCSPTADEVSMNMGYTPDELTEVPEGSNLGLGCGNPVALASVKEGETVLDLGSGAGVDCFLVANRVGESGKVIGVDMTPEMVEKARENAEKNGYQNVEFRLGEIENLPVGDNSVDAVISNCVINLSPDKERVFQEAFRALKPGGRMIISDLVLLEELPEFVRKSVNAYAGCIAGAVMKDEYLHLIEKAGFVNVSVEKEAHQTVQFVVKDKDGCTVTDSTLPAEKREKIEKSIASITVQGVKPA